MKRMTIGTKLMASAGVMLALTLLLSYSGLSTLNTFKKQFDEAVGSSLRKIQLANAMVIGNSEMISEQRGEILAANAKDKSELEKYEKTYKQNLQTVQSSIEEVRPLLINSEAKSLVEDIAQKLSDWAPLHEQLMQQCDAGNVAEANRIRKDLTTPLYNKIDEDARRIAVIQDQDLAGDKADLAQQYSRSRWIAFALLALSLLAAAGVFVVVRGVNRGLRQAVSRAFRRCRPGGQRGLPGLRLQPVPGPGLLRAGRIARRDVGVERRDQLHGAQKHRELACRRRTRYPVPEKVF